MDVLNPPIINYKGYGKIEAFRYAIEIDQRTKEGYKIIEIRRKESLEFVRIYEKILKKDYFEQKNYLQFSDREEFKVLTRISNAEMEEIFSFIAYDSKALTLFNEYIKDVNRQKSQVVETVSKIKPVDEYNVKLSDKIIDEIYITGKSDSDMDCFYYSESAKEKKIHIVINGKVENLYRHSYKSNGTDLADDILFTRELNDEQINYIRYFIAGNEKAQKVFETYIEIMKKEKEKLR